MLSVRALVKAAAIVATLAVGSALAAQVPSNVLFRVIRIRIPTTSCSAFTIDVRGHQYLITARHCLDAQSSPVTQIEWWHDAGWKQLSVKPIFPKNSAVDIAAIPLDQPITPSFDLEPTWTGIQLGQQVYFAGFPLAGPSSRGAIPMPPGFGELPFLKSGIFSAFDERNKDARVIYVDGQNNPGFSGGPIVFRSTLTGAFCVAGVVSGYRTEAFPVMKSTDLNVNPPASAYNDLYVRGNSGIVVGYVIGHILESIEAQLRKSVP